MGVKALKHQLISCIGRASEACALAMQDALIGEHMDIQNLLLARKGKVFRKGIGLVEHTVPEAQLG